VAGVQLALLCGLSTVRSISLAMETRNSILVSKIMVTVDERADSLIGMELRRRIVDRAGVRFLRHGYSAFAMSDLAADLGMSKKTLYVHFRGKDAIVRAVIDGFASRIRAEAEEILTRSGLTFVARLRSFAGHMMARLAQFRPAVIRDLQIKGPQLYRHLKQVRSRNIAHIFSEYVKEGRQAGAVRTEISPDFAGEFFMHAMQGMMDGETLHRLRRSPAETFDEGIRIFFGGLLTPAGQKEYETLFPH